MDGRETGRTGKGGGVVGANGLGDRRRVEQANVLHLS